MRIAIQSQPHHDGHFHLPHQGMWFLLMLIALLMLLSKTVGSSIVDRPSSIVLTVTSIVETVTSIVLTVTSIVSTVIVDRLDDGRWPIDDGRFSASWHIAAR